MTVIIYGAGRHGCVAAGIFRACGESVLGFVDDDHSMAGTDVDGIPVLAQGNALEENRSLARAAFFVGIGASPTRRKIADGLRNRGFMLSNAIHPSAVVMEGCQLGTGLFVAAGAVVVVGCNIANDSVVNTKASIDHDTIIDSGAYLSPGVSTAGGVKIGEEVFVGTGAVIGPNVTVGARSIVGAGAVVLRDLPEGVVAYGAPARIRGPSSTVKSWRELLAR